MKDLMLSVIIPVYKAEQYLKRCVESILKTSYPQIEIILVDDGSPDKSPEICDYYARTDNRVRVIHQKNAGGGFARNTGIKVAEGDYIAFCDDDDFVPIDAYAELMKRAKETKADIVRGTIKRVYEDTGESRLWERCEDSPLYSLAIGLLGGIYRTQFLRDNGLFFTKLNMGPDVYFMIQAIDCADNIQYTNKVTYHYIMRKTDSSETSAMQKADIVYTYYYDDFVWRKMALEYIKRSPKLSEKYENQLSFFCKRVDENWFRYTVNERKACFGVIKDIVSLINWDIQHQNIKDFIHTNERIFFKMNASQFTGWLWVKFKLLGFVKKIGLKNFR